MHEKATLRLPQPYYNRSFVLLSRSYSKRCLDECMIEMCKVTVAVLYRLQLNLRRSNIYESPDRSTQ